MIKKDNITISTGYDMRRRRLLLVTAILFGILLSLASLMMIYGNTIYMPKEVWDVFIKEMTGGASFTIKILRLPRMLAGILCGFAFGVAGSTFQKMLRNPLASPDIIGVTSGASVAAVFGILILKLSGNVVSILAVVSGLIVSTLIYFMAHGEGFSNERLILIGIGMQAFLNALISWILLKASEYDVASALRWLSGSLNGVKLEQIPRLAIVVIGASFAIFALQQYLEVMELGEVYATVLGVQLSVLRLGLILLSLLLIAFATSVTGPIASVAFLSGPIAAKLGGGSSRSVNAGLVGAILVLGGDLIAQYAFPARYPVGVVTGILGAPYLIFLLIRMNKK